MTHATVQSQRLHNASTLQDLVHAQPHARRTGSEKVLVLLGSQDCLKFPCEKRDGKNSLPFLCNLQNVNAGESCLSERPIAPCSLCSLSRLQRSFGEPCLEVGMLVD